MFSTKSMKGNKFCDLLSVTAVKWTTDWRESAIPQYVSILIKGVYLKGKNLLLEKVFSIMSGPPLKGRQNQN